MSKVYQFAVVRSHGTYGSGSKVSPVKRTNDKAAALKAAARATREYKETMSRYGYTSGGYRVVAWGRSDDTILGCDLDRLPTVA